MLKSSWATWAGVDHFARRNGLRGMHADELPTWSTVMRTAPFFLAPFGVLLGMLFFSGYTPQYAAAIATGISFLLLGLDREGRGSLRRWARGLDRAVTSAARQIATVASIIICAGLIIGVLHMTGLGVKVTSVIVGLSGGNLWIALLLTALACLILGGDWQGEDTSCDDPCPDPEGACCLDDFCVVVTEEECMASSWLSTLYSRKSGTPLSL